MTPDEFRDNLVPQIVAMWDTRCCCATPGFQKLISFDFRDYGIGPTALADSEMVIDAILRARFRRSGEPGSRSGEITQVYTCPQCEATCTERYAEFSVSMFRSTVRFDAQTCRAATGFYLVGFHGLKPGDFGRIRDFRPAATREEFIGQFESA